MYELPDTLITGEKSKLPAPYAALADDKVPLPANVQFYEKKLNSGDLLTTVLWSCGLAGLGVILVLFGIYSIWYDFHNVQLHTRVDYWPLIAGVVSLLAAWMMISSLLRRWEIMQLQKQGKSVRLGIFMTPESLFEINEFGYCAIPRAQFKGLTGRTLNYTLRNESKSVRLPQAIAGSTPQALAEAINSWASSPARP